jgi:hypothetical protein
MWEKGDRIQRSRVWGRRATTLELDGYGLVQTQKRCMGSKGRSC